MREHIADNRRRRFGSPKTMIDGVGINNDIEPTFAVPPHPRDILESG